MAMTTRLGQSGWWLRSWQVARLPQGQGRTGGPPAGPASPTPAGSPGWSRDPEEQKTWGIE